MSFLSFRRAISLCAKGVLLAVVVISGLHQWTSFGWLAYIVKITFFTFSLVLCFFLVLFGYKTADRGFDLVEDGRKVYGQIVFWGGIIGLIVVVPGSILFGSYWLIFEDGAWWFWRLL